MKYVVRLLTLILALCASRAEAQTFRTLLQFTGTDGAALGRRPSGSLTLSGTTLYGTTSQGGPNLTGTIFSVSTSGTNFQNLITFTGSGGTANGHFPLGSLTLSGTTLFGTTQAGGTGSGNVFSVGTDGTNYQNLLSFTGTGGAAIGKYPQGSLTLSGSTLYGTTRGRNFPKYDGNVFSVGIDGTNYQNLLSFTGSGTSGTANGQYPDGNLTIVGSRLYGMTERGGALGIGNIFSVFTDGINNQNHLSFTGNGGTATGGTASGSLTLGGTTLYGMTQGDGVNSLGTVFGIGVDGTNFKNLLSFSGSSGATSGARPQGSLTLSGTTLYGMTFQGGRYADGNIFSVGIDGSSYYDLYDFTRGSDGAFPEGDLTLSGGTLFGIASEGGIDNNGTVFALALPVPEPGTLALAGSAAAGALAYRWRRRKQ
jgi:uncharacterized repeat protein (TIGR03803 family)